MTVKSRIIKYALQSVELPFVQMQPGLRLQVVPDFDALPFCQRGQSAAFVARHQLLVVWQDDPKLLLQRAQQLQNALARTLCGAELDDDDDNIKAKTPLDDLTASNDSLAKSDDAGNVPRRTKLWQAIYTGISVMLLTAAIGSGWRQVAIQQIQEPNWLRLLFILCLPAQFWLSLVR